MAERQWVLMKSLMFSVEWFEKFGENLNSNENYKKYAADWEGDIALIIRGDEGSSFFRKGETKNVRLNLYHGKCNSISFPASVSFKDVPYLLESTATTWERILTGKVNVVTALLRGEVKVTGNVKKLMKYVNAAQELVRSAQGIN